MGQVAIAIYAFLAGLTVCGLTGSFLELAARRRLAFAEPFLSPNHLARSAAIVMATGPFMLANAALAAHRDRRISAPAMVSCLATSMLWALALGIVVIAIVSVAADLLGSHLGG